MSRPGSHEGDEVTLEAGTVAFGYPGFRPSQARAIFFVTAVPCPDCACAVWLVSTATAQESAGSGACSPTVRMIRCC
jgi:hypothetical protein